MLVNLEENITNRICSLLEDANRNEKQGGISKALDNRIKRLSVIKEYYKTWDSDKLKALECKIKTI